jgi:hypothetical protein
MQGVTTSAIAATVAANYAGTLLRKHDRIINIRRILGGWATGSQGQTRGFPTFPPQMRCIGSPESSIEVREISWLAVTLF